MNVASPQRLQLALTKRLNDLRDKKFHLTKVILASRAQSHGGVPVGSVLVSNKQIQSFLALLARACSVKKIKPKRVNRISDTTVLVHLPVAAAALFEDQGESIALPYMVKRKQIYTEHNHQKILIGIELTVTVKLYSN